MAKILAFANQKGGIGKTTSAINVAAGIGLLGKKVLLVDLDPQGNSTSGVGVNKRAVKASSYDVLISRAEATDALLKTPYDNLYIMPANMNLAAAEFELVSVSGREKRLDNALSACKNAFDYIIVDCPPSLGILTINALAASDGLIIPMQCEYFALEGLSQLAMTAKQCKKLYNPRLEITGIIITMYNGRLNLTLQVLEELKKYYGDKLISTPVPRSVRLSEAPSYGKPIQYYDRFSKGALAYTDIAKEIVGRI